MDVRRAIGKKGDAIEVRVRWKGRGKGGEQEVTWIAQRQLTGDLRKDARRMWERRQKEEREMLEQQVKRRRTRRSPRLEEVADGQG